MVPFVTAEEKEKKRRLLLMQSFSHQEKCAKTFSRESDSYLSNSPQTDLVILHNEYSWRAFKASIKFDSYIRQQLYQIVAMTLQCDVEKEPVAPPQTNEPYPSFNFAINPPLRQKCASHIAKFGLECDLTRFDFHIDSP
ncbi:hypothetical protein F2P81_002358 [Scophthalmus maximus]|uniref:Uncharacterized protein n=1 Tax=Scophthalmus maximus TaxID=52904 RepID=A0A6A4TLW1_SCOMX|nr:hypothetical protein F2P81_002358 [Scophthalmus maximus]